jgi:diguanylate cyclase (GGDEF)-like protein
MIDIDHFKLVNDTHGHQVGDRVLRAVADAVTESLRHSDVAIRYGGEELLAIVALDPATPARDAARHIADRIREHIAGIPPTEMGVNARVTVSIGAALVEGDETMEAVVQRADTALYRAKDAGRNCTVVYERSS